MVARTTSSWSWPPIEALEGEPRRHLGGLAPRDPHGSCGSTARTPEAAAAPPRLLDRVRHAIRSRHYSRRTEEAYLFWVRRYVVFHDKRHPSQMGSAEITGFLSDLAVRKQVSASTQNQALSALLFLYREVLGQAVEGLEEIVRAKRSVRVPLVLSREEVAAVLRYGHGATGLMASLMYGSGLRLLECACLRVKDLDFDRREITVRDGKGRKDRVTLLPSPLAPALRRHLQQIQAQHAGT
jgi:site-specific recombinase XerD